MLSFVYQVVRSVLRLIVWSLRSRDAQALEVMVLRHQLEVLDRQVGRARFEPQDRLLLAAASRLISRARWHVFSVRPETLLRWHHRLTRRAARWGSKSRGRPPISRDLKNLIVRFAKDNPRWGYKRIQGELKKLGHDVSAMTIRDVLRRLGLGPAPRRAGPSWSEFLHAQASAILACDFFTVYGAWGRTIYVLFAIELSSRRVHLAGCTARPNDVAEPLGSEVIVHFEMDSPPVQTKDVFDLAADLEGSGYQLGREHATFTARLHPRTDANDGTPLKLAVDVENLYLFDKETGAALS
ncbi:MAG TPA: helix-turn-helix domain-containing protein [Actinomycetota bacterium]|nr:helix-turn-helix domain-containing protein [Actinomycetota bacterium]